MVEVFNVDAVEVVRLIWHLELVAQRFEHHLRVVNVVEVWATGAVVHRGQHTALNGKFAIASA
ncbi:hypothetical protein D3C86_2261960 [compost metagenome]